MPGPVALVGSGEYLPSMLEVERGLLDGRPPRYVQIPTAAAPEGDAVLRRWVDLGREQAERLGVEAVPVLARDRADADDPALAAQVEGAGLVYLSGGNPAYLAETLRGTALWRAIEAAWLAGAALAGCSAGAMALSSWAPTPRAWTSDADGLGLLPHLRVVPHFDRMARWLPALALRQVAKVADGVTVVGVDEETAIVGGPERWSVQGRGRAYVVDGDGHRHGHPSGSTLSTPLRPTAH